MSTCGTAPRTAQRLPESYDMKTPLDPYGLERCARYWHKSKRIQYAEAERRSDRLARRADWAIRRAGRLAAPTRAVRMIRITRSIVMTDLLTRCAATALPWRRAPSRYRRSLSQE